jgi:hypothetical protein
MKVGIIVHSFTGNTLTVAEKVKETLEAAGHAVTLERVTVKDENPNAATPVTLANAPEAAGYDLALSRARTGVLAFAGMKTYLEQISDLQGCKVGCFVTHFFPSRGWGRSTRFPDGKPARRKHGHVVADGSVSWSRKSRQQQIDRVAETMAAAAGKEKP